MSDIVPGTLVEWVAPSHPATYRRGDVRTCRATPPIGCMTGGAAYTVIVHDDPRPWCPSCWRPVRGMSPDDLAALLAPMPDEVAA